jgi:hypothetical protein
VQIVHGSRRGSRTIEHIGSAHDELELEALKAAARQRLAGGQGELDLGLDGSVSAAAASLAAPSGRPLEIVSSRMGHLWDGLNSAYDVLGFARAAGGDEVSRQLVLARIIEPTSTQDSPRVLAEVGVDTVSYPTLNRHPRGFSAEGVPSQPRRGVRPARQARADVAGALRRVHPLLRDRRRGRVPRTGVLQGNAAWSHRSPSGRSPTTRGSR